MSDVRLEACQAALTETQNELVEAADRIEALEQMLREIAAGAPARRIEALEGALRKLIEAADDPYEYEWVVAIARAALEGE